MELKYSGAEIDVHVPFPPVVKRICEKVEERLGERFNHVLLNRYVFSRLYLNWTIASRHYNEPGRNEQGG